MRIYREDFQQRNWQHGLRASTLTPVVEASHAAPYAAAQEVANPFAHKAPVTALPTTSFDVVQSAPATAPHWLHSRPRKEPCQRPPARLSFRPHSLLRSGLRLVFPLRFHQE